MLTPLGHDALNRALQVRNEVTEGSYDLSQSWLDSVGSYVVAEESGRHLEPSESARLAGALAAAGAQHLVAVTNDPLILKDFGYSFEPTPTNLDLFSDEFSGLSACLTTEPVLPLCALFTANNFRLVAGPLTFVRPYVGDLSAARAEFLDFANDPDSELDRQLKKAATRMAWIDQRFWT